MGCQKLKDKFFKYTIIKCAKTSAGSLFSVVCLHTNRFWYPQNSQGIPGKNGKILEISGNHSNELAHLKKNLIIIDAVICLNLHL